METLTGELGQAMILVVHSAMKVELFIVLSPTYALACLQHSEFDVALEGCHRLMSLPTPDAWQVCRYSTIHAIAVLSVHCSELATVDKLHDLQIR